MFFCRTSVRFSQGIEAIPIRTRTSCCMALGQASVSSAPSKPPQLIRYVFVIIPCFLCLMWHLELVCPLSADLAFVIASCPSSEVSECSELRKDSAALLAVRSVPIAEVIVLCYSVLVCFCLFFGHSSLSSSSLFLTSMHSLSLCSPLHPLPASTE